MMMGADYYETDAEMASLLASGKVPLGVGTNSKIRWVKRSGSVLLRMFFFVLSVVDIFFSNR